MIGCEFSERMAGTWHRLDAPGDERPFEFTVRAHVRSLRGLLLGTVATLEGHVVAEGLCARSPLLGATLALGLGKLLLERRLHYQFRFRGDDGRTYRFDGSKEISLVDLPRTMTTLPGYVYDERAQEVGRTLLRFDLQRDTLSFLRSWRPVLGLARSGR